jgi:serine/threonine-protein kinase
VSDEHPITSGSRPSEPTADAPTEIDLSQREPMTRREPRAADEGATVSLRQVSLESTHGETVSRTDAYVGFIIDGRYHVESVIAAGGMGVVYKARHRMIDKPVAIKILRPELVDNRDITERFLVEAQAASAIGSEHIVDVTDYGELPDGATYIVMEYLEGESLGKRIKNVEEPLLIDEIVDIGRQLAEGLHQAHEAQIIHRDLKPDNVLLLSRHKQGNYVKILDFGIAKVQSSQNQATRAGRIFGTPHYMSPEQARGEPLDRRSDIYSLGVMLYQMLARKLPFDGENPLGILTQHMYVAPKPLAEASERAVPAGFEAIVAKCMSKERDDRYASMAELEADLARFDAGQRPLAIDDVRRLKEAPDSLRRRLNKVRQKSRPSRMPLYAMLIALLFGGGWFFFDRREAPSVEPNALPGTAAAQSSGMKTVALVLAPIDAHVFHGGRDLGTMPINVRVREGQVLTFEVRREGFRTQTLQVDGSQSKALVQLEPIPGHEPASPIAAAPSEREARVFTFADAGLVPPAPKRAAPHRDDAGAPRPVSSAGTGGGNGDTAETVPPSAVTAPSVESAPSVDPPEQPMRPPGPPPRDEP